MLHELLLSLSGHPSPLLSNKIGEKTGDNDRLLSLLSPAELALLRTLSEELGEKNRVVREDATSLTPSHPSVVCRAVAAAVISIHLANFQQKILDVEKSILQGDPTFVGAYNAVPLSAIVSAFDGWGRRLQWLCDIIQYIQPHSFEGTDKRGDKPCTAASIIQKLRAETYTGFPEIEAMALQLVNVAEMAWLKQLSAWVLYGRHPGGLDFFVTDKNVGDKGSRFDSFGLDKTLIPCFVTPSSANSILFIGKSLNHLKERQSTTSNSGTRILPPDTSLLSTHLVQLSALAPPVSAASFSAAISSIRLSLSLNALQKLLPISQVVETLHILKNFFLLERGEFAVALITAADNRLSQRHHRGAEKRKQGVDGINDLANLTIRDGEVHNVLARTWTALASLGNLEDEAVDEELDSARELITLSIKSLDKQKTLNNPDERAQAPSVMFDDLLLPSPTLLSIRVLSPLDLFLSSADVSNYSSIHSYLLAIRRSHLHLSQLFQLSTLRREHPSPKAARNAEHERDASREQRLRSMQFTRRMRPIWATIGSAAFFLAELGGYFQGEVILSSWNTLQDWISPKIDNQAPSTASSMRLGSSHTSSRPSSSRQSNDIVRYGVHDPESLAQAHRAYLSTLCHCILLDNTEFTAALRRQMTAIDHLCGLMQRLDGIHANLLASLNDTNDDIGIHFDVEERRLMSDLSAAQPKVAEGTKKLITSLREIDARKVGGHGIRISQADLDSDFVPWTASGLDRLLLKFDYANDDGLVPSHFGER